MSDRPTCPECGSDLDLRYTKGEFDYSTFSCGTELNHKTGFVHVDDECRERSVVKAERARIVALETLLRGWLTAFQKYGPSGSHQFEKFDTIKRDTEMALEPNTEGK